MNYFGLFFTFTMLGVSIGLCGGWVLGAEWTREELRRKCRRK